VGQERPWRRSSRPIVNRRLGSRRHDGGLSHDGTARCAFATIGSGSALRGLQFGALTAIELLDCARVEPLARVAACKARLASGCSSSESAPLREGGRMASGSLATAGQPVGLWRRAELRLARAPSRCRATSACVSAMDRVARICRLLPRCHVAFAPALSRE
jgi:hypothetical protein